MRRSAPWLVVAFVAVMAFVRSPAILAGDGQEYFLMLEAWSAHGTPDVRASDGARLRPILAAHGRSLEPVHNGFFPDRSGRWYGYHFSAYPLAAVPAKLALRALGGDEFLAFHVTNLVFVGLGLAAALRARALSLERRALFAAIAVASPALWYVGWPHAEIFEWLFVVLGLIAMPRWGRAATCFAIASWQSPPIALLALLMAALSLRERRWAPVARATAGALLALVPGVFYWLHFRHPNPIAATGLADVRLITAGRVAGFWLDLDQGLLVHAPAITLGAIALVAASRARDWTAGALVLCALGMSVLSSSAANWNAGCCGVLRYGVWTLPVLAWVAARWLPATAPSIGAALVLVGAQAAHVAARDGDDDSLKHGALARFVLAKAPSLYDPDPEIFVERTLGRPTDSPWSPFPLPVGFVDGASVTKLLVDARGLDALSSEFDVDPTYLDSVRTRVSNARGALYLEPPKGAVKPRPGAPRLTRDTFDGVEPGDGWHALHHDGESTWVCMGAHGTLQLRGETPSRTLAVRAWPPLDLIGHPIGIRVTVAGRVVDDVDAFCRFTRRYAIPAGVSSVTFDASETVTWPGEGETALCIDAAAWR